jgi:hypothetical protein
MQRNHATKFFLVVSLSDIIKNIDVVWRIFSSSYAKCKGTKHEEIFPLTTQNIV